MLIENIFFIFLNIFVELSSFAEGTLLEMFTDSAFSVLLFIPCELDLEFVLKISAYFTRFVDINALMYLSFFFLFGTWITLSLFCNIIFLPLICILFSCGFGFRSKLNKFVLKCFYITCS